MIEDISKLFAIQCQIKNLSLTFRCANNECDSEIYSDEKRLKQIIINLISNALKVLLIAHSLSPFQNS